MAALALIRLMARRDCFYGLSMRSPPLPFPHSLSPFPFIHSLRGERAKAKSRRPQTALVRWCCQEKAIEVDG